MSTAPSLPPPAPSRAKLLGFGWDTPGRAFRPPGAGLSSLEALSCRIPQQIRILGSLVAIGLVFLITAVMVKVAMEPLPFFIFTMISIVFINCERGRGAGTGLCGKDGDLQGLPAEVQRTLAFGFSLLLLVFPLAAFGAILQSSLFGLAGLLPANYTAPIMSGQGLAGIFAALAMIFSIASE